MSAFHRSYTETDPCPECVGTGRILVTRQFLRVFRWNVMRDCIVCNGTGKIAPFVAFALRIQTAVDGDTHE